MLLTYAYTYSNYLYHQYKMLNNLQFYYPKVFLFQYIVTNIKGTFRK
jgi:hypothetical protein